MQNLDAFLEIERLMRSGDIKDARQIDLPEYWQDLALVLLRCADTRFKRGTKALEENFAHINDEFYRQFFVKRPTIVPRTRIQNTFQDKLDFDKK